MAMPAAQMVFEFIIFMSDASRVENPALGCEMGSRAKAR
jgi:hypothetical protein